MINRPSTLPENRAVRVLAAIPPGTAGRVEVQEKLDLLRAIKRYRYSPTPPAFPTTPADVPAFLDTVSAQAAVVPGVQGMVDMAYNHANDLLTAEMSSHVDSFLPVIAERFNALAPVFVDLYGDGFPVNKSDLVDLGSVGLKRYEDARGISAQLEELLTLATVVLGLEEPSSAEIYSLVTPDVVSNAQFRAVHGQFQRLQPPPGFGMVSMFRPGYDLDMPTTAAEHRRREVVMITEPTGGYR
jgi:hypothetical protein